MYYSLSDLLKLPEYQTHADSKEPFTLRGYELCTICVKNNIPDWLNCYTTREEDHEYIMKSRQFYHERLYGGKNNSSSPMIDLFPEGEQPFGGAPVMLMNGTPVSGNHHVQPQFWQMYNTYLLLHVWINTFM